MNQPHVNVLIVGGGPTGLFLGSLLVQEGFTCRVLERRASSTTHSRSIGIHPPSLERLDLIGVSDTLRHQGVQVGGGLAYVDGRKAGTLSFESCPPPFPFVLSLPQYETEAILESRLTGLDPDALVRDTEVVSLSAALDAVHIETITDGTPRTYSADFVIGCDGRDSTVRRYAGISFPGKEYADTYIMGDFSDTSELGSQAGIFLGREGVVESFPLPGAKRRWVVKTDSLREDPDPAELAQLIQSRTGHAVDAAACSMISSFTASNYMASRMSKGRIALAGDAAHVVSPIGGQGMNLGWLDAHALYKVLLGVRADNHTSATPFNGYERARRRAAKAARRRAELNMWLGRGYTLGWVRRWAVRFILSSTIQPYFARQFTMRGLE